MATTAQDLPADADTLVLTIGHSTRPIEEFLELLEANGVQRVIDVRTVPRSRRNPQYDQANLPASLEAAGIDYEQAPALGGFRRTSDDSPNTGWRNLSFRGYADYMQTPEFEQALDQLMVTAHKERVALMCAEAVPWRCHRSLIADALVVRGVPVEEIISGPRRQIHKLTRFAKVEGTRITYPPEALAPEHESA